MNNLICGECLEILKNLPDKSVDLVITDPPYEFDSGGGGGSFGVNKRDYHKEVHNLGITRYDKECPFDETGKSRLNIEKRKATASIGGLLSVGFDFAVLDECCRVLKAINIYVWCSKAQVRKLLEYFENKGCNIDILTWHKTNPIPTCNNTYLSDTEYCIFAREKGVKVWGGYETKHKYYVSKINTADKEKWGHPTIKPLNIIENLIINSSQEGDTVLDCFMGSGTTGVACKKLNRDFIGIEINKKYYETACKRIDNDSNYDENNQIEGQMNIADFLS